MTISPQTGQIDLKRSSKRRTLIRTTFSVHHASSDVAHQQTIGKHAVQPGIAADRFARKIVRFLIPFLRRARGS